MSTQTMHALGARLAAGRDLLGDVLQDSRTKVAARGREGLDGARSLGLEVMQGARRSGRAAGRAIAGHPWETVLLAGLAGAAIGWIVRHAWRAEQAPARVSRKPRTRTARATRKR